MEEKAALEEEEERLEEYKNVLSTVDESDFDAFTFVDDDDVHRFTKGATLHVWDMSPKESPHVFGALYSVAAVGQLLTFKETQDSEASTDRYVASVDIGEPSKAELKKVKHRIVEILAATFTAEYNESRDLQTETDKEWGDFPVHDSQGTRRHEHGARDGSRGYCEATLRRHWQVHDDPRVEFAATVKEGEVNFALHISNTFTSTREL